MNELPIIEGYVRLSLKSWLILTAIISFNTIYFVFAGHLSVFLLFLIILNVFSAFIIIWNKRKGKPAVRIFEDRLETKLALQKEYMRCYFKDISKAEMQYVFPNHEIVMLEFKDGRKPLKIKMSDLDVPVEVLYKVIVERIS